MEVDVCFSILKHVWFTVSFSVRDVVWSVGNVVLTKLNPSIFVFNIFHAG